MARVRDLWFKTVTRTDGVQRREQTGRHGNGKRWLAVWIGPDGKEKTKAFLKKSDAEKYAIKMDADQLTGTYIDPKRGQVKLREYAEEHWVPAMVHLRPNSMETYQSHLKNHVLPAFGDRRIGSLTRPDMKSFVALLTKTLAPSTVETVFAVIRALMHAAVDDGVIPANPCLRVPLPRVGARVVEPLPTATVLALADAITPRYRLAVWFGFGLGLRQGEALGVTEARVEFLKRRVRIEQQAQKGALVELKTKASQRVLPIDDGVLAEITKHMQRYPRGPEGVIIANRIRKIPRRSSFGDCWRAAVSAVGLPEGTRFHDLRHYYASTLIAANLNPKSIQRRLGHATISETFDTYGHLFPDDEDLGRGAIDAKIKKDLAEQKRNKKEA
ncbi:tyrosine-type recombinase/integrase [Nonomuraea typhae]|uniref:Tyrosine-type recombinase/integrase n=1 Tax=Nonomuraea typhae TaxID=2603600 RepID=A0ABW7YMT6_9ACTN